MKKNILKKRGFGLVEIVLGSAIITSAFFGVLSVAKNSLRVNEVQLREAEAGYLLLEGEEAVRSMRDISWTNINGLSTTTTYYISFSTTTGRFSTSTQYQLIDSIFERSFTTSNVYRNGSDVISQSGTYDAGTRKINMNISWLNRNATTTITANFYLSNI